MRRHFQQDVGSRRNGPGAPIPAAPTEVVSQLRVDLGGRWNGSRTALPTTAPEAEWFSQFTTDVDGRWDGAGSAVSTKADKRQVPGRLDKR